MMTRFLTVLVCTVLATLASAQTSGRHFHRDSRTPATPPASRVVDASATKNSLAPLQKLHSGRPWPRHHFGRLPHPATATTTNAVDASAKKAPAPRGFWRKRR
jgi:hypothetical protein